MRLLLLHPPLLSPAVWSHLVAALEAEGHEAAAPHLLPGGLGPEDVEAWWRAARDVAVRAAPRAQVVLAHSGAGALAPAVLEALPSAEAVVLVDAVLAAPTGVHRTPPGQRAAVADLATGGMLPRWTTWWGEAALAELVPDPADRATLDAGAPELPEAFYDVEVPLPVGWEPARRGYLRTSEAYADAERRAAERGWRTRAIDGTHLSVLTDAPQVARAVLDLLG